MAEGVNHGGADRDRTTALMHASGNGRLDIVKLLLQDERVDPAAADN